MTTLFSTAHAGDAELRRRARGTILPRRARRHLVPNLMGVMALISRGRTSGLIARAGGENLLILPLRFPSTTTLMTPAVLPGGSMRPARALAVPMLLAVLLLVPALPASTAFASASERLGREHLPTYERLNANPAARKKTYYAR